MKRAFISPSKGRLSLDEVFEDIKAYILEKPKFRYKLIIGTDSHLREDVCFVTAIIVHRIGKGARYYYRRIYKQNIINLRQRIFTETSLSLEIMDLLKPKLDRMKHLDMDIEVHVDIGEKGDTKELIKEVVGWVMGSGYTIKIKPEASGASKVADKYTK